MATIAYQPIRLLNVGPNAEGDAIIGYFPFSGTVNEGDILSIAAGTVSQASQVALGGNGPTGVVGMAMFAGTSVYHAFSNAGVGLNFAFDQTNTALVPATNQFMGVAQFDNNMRIEISLSQASTLATSLVGTQVGLAWNGAAGVYIADPTMTGTHLIATIVSLPGGPDVPANRLGLSNGVIGDLGGRVAIQFLATGLQL